MRPAAPSVGPPASTGSGIRDGATRSPEVTDASAPRASARSSARRNARSADHVEVDPAEPDEHEQRGRPLDILGPELGLDAGERGDAARGQLGRHPSRTGAPRRRACRTSAARAGRGTAGPRSDRRTLGARGAALVAIEASTRNGPEPIGRSACGFAALGDRGRPAARAAAPARPAAPWSPARPRPRSPGRDRGDRGQRPPRRRGAHALERRRDIGGGQHAAVVERDALLDRHPELVARVDDRRPRREVRLRVAVGADPVQRVEDSSIAVSSACACAAADPA